MLKSNQLMWYVFKKQFNFYLSLFIPFLCIFSLFILLLMNCSEQNNDQKSITDADPVKVRMAVLFSKDHYLGKKLDWIAQSLENRSGNRFKCQVFHGGIAGGEKEQLEDLLLGNLELMSGAGSYFYHYCPEANVVELPLYEWQSREEAREVIKGYWPEFIKIAARKGFYPVGLDIRDNWGVWYKKPVTSLDAIKGAKFRSVNAEFWIEITKLYGAIPNPMPYADAYMAFKTGVCDGVVAAVTNATAANWHEVLKCFLDTRLVASESFMLTSKKWLEGLPPDLREIFLDVCLESEDYNLLEIEKQYNEHKKEMIESGVTVIEHENLDLSFLYDNVPQFREEYMKNKGSEVYEFYKNWMNYVKEKTGRSL